MNLLNNPEKRKWMIVVTIFIAIICNYLDRQLLSILKPINHKKGLHSSNADKKHSPNTNQMQS